MPQCIMEHESTLTLSIIVVEVGLDLAWFSIRSQKDGSLTSAAAETSGPVTWRGHHPSCREPAATGGNLTFQASSSFKL